MLTLNDAIKNNKKSIERVLNLVDNAIKDKSTLGFYQCEVNKIWDERITKNVIQEVESRGFTVHDKSKTLIIRWL